MNQKLKPLKTYLPIVFFAAFACYWLVENYLSSQTVNYVALAGIVLMSAQAIFKNKILGFCMGIILMTASFYFLLAVLDEYIDLKSGGVTANSLIIGGAISTCLAFAMSALMTATNFNKLQNG